VNAPRKEPPYGKEFPFERQWRCGSAGGACADDAPRMEGMVVFDYADRYALAVKDIAQWMKEGKFVSEEDLGAGIENFPDTLKMLE
jgi:NADPH-dependent curcumin reductase CurA